MSQALIQGRPVFVTMRCLPCKQCSAFDKSVLEGGTDLDPLLKQFITVRLTNANDADLRLLPMAGFQDLDLSWWGWMLSPEGRIYGVFGGRDEVSDATRISVPALAATLQRVLAHHYDPRRPKWEAQWNLDGPVPDLSGKASRPTQLPGYESWHGKAGKEVKAQACLHCHQVNDVLRQPKVDAKAFDKDRDFQVWPLPENLGLTLDRDHGLLVKAVDPSSPAAAAGLKPGDTLAAAGSDVEPQARRLFSQADLRGVLHRGPPRDGSIDLWWLRDGKPMHGKLAVRDGWRRTVLDWRISVSQGVASVWPGFFPLAASAQERKSRGIAEGAMAVKPFVGPKTKSFAFEAGLRGDHVITAVDDESPNVAGRAFLVWFMKHHELGDRVTLSVVDAKGQKQTITFTLRRWEG